MAAPISSWSLLLFFPFLGVFFPFFFPSASCIASDETPICLRVCCLRLRRLRTVGRKPGKTSEHGVVLEPRRTPLNKAKWRKEKVLGNINFGKSHPATRLSSFCTIFERHIWFVSWSLFWGRFRGAYERDDCSGYNNEIRERSHKRTLSWLCRFRLKLRQNISSAFFFAGLESFMAARFVPDDVVSCGEWFMAATRRFLV